MSVTKQSRNERANSQHWAVSKRPADLRSQLGALGLGTLIDTKWTSLPQVAISRDDGQIVTSRLPGLGALQFRNHQGRARRKRQNHLPFDDAHGQHTDMLGGCETAVYSCVCKARVASSERPALGASA